MKDQIKSLGNWNAVYAFLKRSGMEYRIETVEFGFGKKALAEKENWLSGEPDNEIRLHYHSVLKRARSNGFTFNLIRGQKIVFDAN